MMIYIGDGRGQVKNARKSEDSEAEHRIATIFLDASIEVDWRGQAQNVWKMRGKARTWRGGCQNV